MGDGGEVEHLSRLRDDLNQSLTSLLLRTSFPTPMGGSRRGAVQTGSGVQGRSAVPATGRGRRVGASPGGATIFLDSERELRAFAKEIKRLTIEDKRRGIGV